MVVEPSRHYLDNFGLTMSAGVDSDVGRSERIPQPIMLFFEDIGRPGGRTPPPECGQIKIKGHDDIGLPPSPEIANDTVFLRDNPGIIALLPQAFHKRCFPGAAGSDDHNATRIDRVRFLVHFGISLVHGRTPAVRPLGIGRSFGGSAYRVPAPRWTVRSQPYRHLDVPDPAQ